jgi:putative transposase
MPSHPYRRELPHVFPPGVPIFVTWRLFGSLPVRRIRSATNPKISAGQCFRDVDWAHDRTVSGALWLRDARVARMVCEEIESGASYRGQYVLHEFVVMPNHVHMLVFPSAEMAEVMHHIKLRTAQQANRILRRVGQSFWQSESFDHWCRSVQEMVKVRQYIVMNPVKAGLARRPQDWPWCSFSRKLARRRGELPVALPKGASASHKATESISMPHKAP